MARRSKRAVAERSVTIVEATKNLLAAVRGAYDEDRGHESLTAAYQGLQRLLNVSSVKGEEIPDWPGNCINQSDAIEVVMDLLERYDAHLPTEGD